MHIAPISCLSDNYAYALICTETKEAAIVDASEAAPVLSFLRERSEHASDGLREQVKVVAILSTHHHFDHVGGNEELVNALGGERSLRIYGHASDRGRIPGQTEFLEDGESFSIGKLIVKAMHVPGHTTGAVAYQVTKEPEDPVVFTGDTLFFAGCGRLFEGTPAMMHASLSKLARLEGRTRVYCGHEYTLANLAFAAHLEPNHTAIGQARARASQLRGERRPTMPSTIDGERSYNPFLRVDSPELRASLGIAKDADAVTAFAAIRAAKDTFRA